MYQAHVNQVHQSLLAKTTHSKGILFPPQRLHLCCLLHNQLLFLQGKVASAVPCSAKASTRVAPVLLAEERLPISNRLLPAPSKCLKSGHRDRMEAVLAVRKFVLRAGIPKAKAA